MATRFRRMSRLALLAPLLTTACVVGPNFKQPAPPPVSSYSAKAPETTEATPGVPGGNAQHFVTAADIPADWWTMFHAKALNALTHAMCISMKQQLAEWASDDAI